MSNPQNDSGSSRPSSIRHKDHLSHSLNWAGLSLFGYFLYNVIFGNLPADLLNPRWQLQEIGTVLSLAYLPLIGCLLIYLAAAINGADQTLNQRVLLLRRLSTWVAIGFLLLVPLQVSTGLRLLNLQKLTDSAALTQWKSFRQKLAITASENELRSLLSQLKEPIVLPPKLDEPFEQLRARLISDLDQRMSRTESEAALARSTTASALIRDLSRSIVYALLWCLGFAAFADSGTGRGSLLQRVQGAVRLGQRGGASSSRQRSRVK